jgi:hypothetical protein
MWGGSEKKRARQLQSVRTVCYGSPAPDRHDHKSLICNHPNHDAIEFLIGSAFRLETSLTSFASTKISFLIGSRLSPNETLTGHLEIPSFLGGKWPRHKSLAPQNRGELHGPRQSQAWGSNSLSNDSRGAGSTATSARFAWTCSMRLIPARAVVTPGTERTNCSASAESLCRPSAARM